MAIPLWVKALTATLALQSVSSFLSRSMPVIGPVLTEAGGVAPTSVGYLAAATALGSLWGFTGAAASLPRFGSVRLMQIGACVGAAGILAAAAGFWPLMLFAAFLVGAGYAPSPPAGSDILARHAPKQHMSLVFSVKQAGVPLGGVAAGLLIPAVTLAAGWRAGLLAATLAALVPVLLIQPWRKEIDARSDANYRIGWRPFFSLDVVAAPIRAMKLGPAILPMTIAGFGFSMVQGSLLAFFVTYLTQEVQIGLATAGAVFAAMQVSGTLARIGAGYCADKIGSNRRTLQVLALGSALAILGVSALKPGDPLIWVMAIGLFAGVASISWNGVYLAEVARVAPAGKIGDATAGSTFFTFIGYVIGPAIFAEAVTLSGSYGMSFAGLALLPGVALLALTRGAKED
jgi:MFS family permease